MTLNSAVYYYFVKRLTNLASIWQALLFYKAMLFPHFMCYILYSEHIE